MCDHPNGCRGTSRPDFRLRLIFSGLPATGTPPAFAKVDVKVQRAFSQLPAVYITAVSSRRPNLQRLDQPLRFALEANSQRCPGSENTSASSLISPASCVSPSWHPTYPQEVRSARHDLPTPSTFAAACRKLAWWSRADDRAGLAL